MIILWGEDRLAFYNDAYIHVLGPKHPAALGTPGAVLWGELWSSVRIDIDKAFAGESVWRGDIYLPMFRVGYLEETYFNYSMSPILVNGGKIGGILCPSFEVTNRVTHARRQHCLQEIGSKAGKALTEAEACRLAAEGLSTGPADVPFAMIYLVEGEGRQRQ
ncbi:hypothetical protein HK097_001103, partial [Rhizophlyctis rosea]